MQTNMTDQEIRLRCLELALDHAVDTDKVAAAREFEAFVFKHSIKKEKSK